MRAHAEKRGMAVFVIGNTQYRDVKIDNAKHLENCMIVRVFPA